MSSPSLDTCSNQSPNTPEHPERARVERSDTRGSRRTPDTLAQRTPFTAFLRMRFAPTTNDQRPAARCTFALASLLLLCVTAVATTVIPLSVEQLTTRSEVVVEARALQSWSQWDTNDHLIYTYTRFTTARALKGAPAQTFVVRQMGGSAGGYRQHVSGIRYFAPGDEAVLFLRRSVAPGNMAVVGLIQGNFAVERESNGEVHVSNGMPEVNQAAAGQISAYSGSRMSLSELESRVKAVRP